jgi:hypothetical protein
MTSQEASKTCLYGRESFFPGIIPSGLIVSAKFLFSSLTVPFLDESAPLDQHEASYVDHYRRGLVVTVSVVSGLGLWLRVLNSMGSRPC